MERVEIDGGGWYNSSIMENYFPMEERIVKRIWNVNYLPLLVLISGTVGFFLRLTLYARYFDGALLPVGHPLELALTALTVLVAVLVVLVCRKLAGPEGYKDNFTISLRAALGHILLASGIVLTVLANPPAMAGMTGQLWKMLGVFCGPALIYAGFARAMGKKPNFWCYVVVCVFFALHMVSHYRTWCSDPQVQNYVFSLTGTMALTLFAYQQAAVCVDLGSRRKLLVMGLLAAYLCMAALAQTQYGYLYLGGAVWALTGLCRPEPKEVGDSHGAA